MIAQMAKQSADRRVIKIAVAPAAKDAVQAFSDEYGMTEYVVASRFYEWFAAQDDIYKRAVMGMLHGLEVDAARVYMERWAQTARERAEADRILIGQEPTTPQSRTAERESAAAGKLKGEGGSPPPRPPGSKRDSAPKPVHGR